MPQKNHAVVKAGNYGMPDLFPEEKDRTGRDILAMPDFFGILRKGRNTRLKACSAQQIFSSTTAYSGILATLMNMKYHISNMGTFIADIPEGCNLGMSRKVEGTWSPLIFKDGKLVGQVTLKKAVDPSSALADLSTLSIQAQLQKISCQLENIHRDIKYIIADSRREKFNNRFFNARDLILQAQTASKSEQEALLRHADRYLMEGYYSLYGDIEAQIEELAKCGTLTSDDTVKSLLSNAIEDIHMIHQFVSLRACLFHHRGRVEQAARILEGYGALYRTLHQEKKYKDGKRTGFELIHTNCSYKEGITDLWLERPKQMLNAINSYRTLQEQKGKDVFLIGVKK